MTGIGIKLTRRSTRHVSEVRFQFLSTHDWRVVRYLLYDQLGLSSAVQIRPNTVKQFSENRIEGLAGISSLLWPVRRRLTFFSDPIFSLRVCAYQRLSKRTRHTHRILSLEGRNEPPQDALHPILS